MNRYPPFYSFRILQDYAIADVTYHIRKPFPFYHARGRFIPPELQHLPLTEPTRRIPVLPFTIMMLTMEAPP